MKLRGQNTHQVWRIGKGEVPRFAQGETRHVRPTKAARPAWITDVAADIGWSERWIVVSNLNHVALHCTSSLGNENSGNCDELQVRSHRPQQKATAHRSGC